MTHGKMRFREEPFRSGPVFLLPGVSVLVLLLLFLTLFEPAQARRRRPPREQKQERAQNQAAQEKTAPEAEPRATAVRDESAPIVHLALNLEWTGDTDIGVWMGQGYYRLFRGYHTGGDLFLNLTAEASAIPLGSCDLTLEVRVRGVELEPLGKFGGTGSTDGKFISPSGVSADYQGNIFVVDTGNDRVQKFSPEGIYLDQFGEFSWDDPSETAQDTGENENGSFNEPADVFATIKEILVLDAENHRVSRFDRHLIFIHSFGSFGDGDGEFEKPVALSVDETRNVYVLDRENDCIQKLDIDGNFMMKIGRFGWSSGLLNAPQDMACTGKGELFVADTGNERVVRFDEFGNFAAQFQSPGKRFVPKAIALGADNLVYVADSAGSRIVAYDQEGRILGIRQSAPESPRGLEAARMMNGQVRLYLTDGASNRVFIYDAKPRERNRSLRLNLSAKQAEEKSQ